ncbi:DUF934 domain-containing protein [Puniceibacterium sp. IMCC21224]|uniref:DUF934 domain-containing protein n=1 Tax=Puniceibacterium sp. IMCC21224 TaxID=1618204 RepID=UPI00064E0270|nr:DUF934 domain-containing protein [Puniceibacterium sp. IMCC21224]KMK66874.1 Bacterial protein of unknown function (DUF934) [Puniceibacterium sp. IMCC21224]
MSVIVTDSGFSADDWQAGFAVFEAAETATDQALDLASDTAPEDLDRAQGAPMIRIAFPSFSDGRGFTLARLLRLRGYKGRLRAQGHVISDQYAMARRAGFDEVEIDDAQAERQPAAEWRFRADWQAHDYQARLRG